MGQILIFIVVFVLAYRALSELFLASLCAAQRPQKGSILCMPSGNKQPKQTGKQPNGIRQLGARNEVGGSKVRLLEAKE